MLTLPELNVVMPLLDAGVRASGLQLFKNDGGVVFQAALAKLQGMADAQAAHAEAQQLAALKAEILEQLKQEAADGEDQHHD